MNVKALSVMPVNEEEVKRRHPKLSLEESK